MVLKFAANLSWLYTELPFLDRFAAAARDGFTGVECLFPHEHPTDEIKARLDDLGLKLVLFNAEPGDWAGGERGLGCLPSRGEDFKRSIREALARADRLGCDQVHVMAGLCKQDITPGHLASWQIFEERLVWAAHQARVAGKTLLIEPINPRDMPHYLLSHQGPAHELVQRVGPEHLGVQMDLYHCQIVEGDITRRLEEAIPTGRVKHIQMAGVPDRTEPDQGEVNHAHVLNTLQRLGYGGWIGCEYRPRQAGPGGTTAGLGWLKPWH